MIKILKYVILLWFINIFISAVADGKNGGNSELKLLVAAANLEMNGDFENRNPDGSFKQTNRCHLEMFENSVAYVSVFINSYIDAINNLEDYKNRQLEIFSYGDPNPHFKELLNYLVKHDLPLYMYCISKDGKHKTSVLMFDKADLSQFGINATESPGCGTMPLEKENGSPQELTINVECRESAILGSLFNIDYVVSYKGEKGIDFKFIFDKNVDDHAKFLYFGKISQKTSASLNGNGSTDTTHKEVWSATWRAVKTGMFVSPAFAITVINGANVDTLDVAAPRKTINITKAGRQVIEEKEKSRKEIIRLRKSKDSILGVAELEESEYQVGDTIHCIVSLLNEVTDPACDVQSVAIDDTFVIKGCDYKVVLFDEAKFDEMELNGKHYYKIRFAEISISPQRAGVVEIPRIKLTGYKLIQMWKKDKFWFNLPEIIENYRYGVYTNPLKVLVK